MRAVQMGHTRISETVLIGGTLAGTLDLLDALIFWSVRGAQPIRILQSIASGLLGPRAYQGGVATAALGVALHFFIAGVVAAVYAVAAKRLPQLNRRAVLSGVAYGIAVFIVMQYLVLPLSLFRVRPMPWPALINAVAIHALGVGLPIALVAAGSTRRARIDET